jgi:hypothetical protein
MVRITRKRAVAATGLGFATVIGAGALGSPAGASTQGKAYDFDFVTSSGDAVTCRVQTTRTWGGSDGTSSLYAATSVVGGPDVCYDSVAYVSATYNDPSGQSVVSEETAGANGSVSQTYATASSPNPKTYHRVQFSDCGYDDAALCTTPTYSNVGCAI